MHSQFLIGATRSGSGKTLITLGIMAALAKRGLVVQPFKCGPDFIDPTLHRLAAGRTSINLDLYMMGPEHCREAFHRYGADGEVAAVEGVMGLFDGGVASSASLARCLDLQVLLVIDVRSAAESIAAVLKGFEQFDPAVRLCGVVFNRIGSARHRQLIEQAVAEHCSTEVLGYFPRDVEFTLESRHLGLHMGHELSGFEERLAKLAETVERHIALDRLLELSRERHPVATERLSVANGNDGDRTIRLAVARDEAFCFYYEENFDAMKDLGFELVPFSPLRDRALPHDIQGVYLGGGYPELHARVLAENVEMRRSLSDWAAGGGFVYGECGGFMYMCRELTDGEGTVFPMTGIFPVAVKMRPRLSRLGYRCATLSADCAMGEQGQQFYGHEFHYSDIVERSKNIDYLYTTENGESEGCIRHNAIGSYIHLHFARSRRNLQRLHAFLNLNRQGIW